MTRKQTYEELRKRVKTRKKDTVRREQAMEAQEKEHYYRSLLFSLHEDILVIDRNYRIIDMTNTFLHTTGLRREEVVGRHCYEVSHGRNEPCEKDDEGCKLHEVFEMSKPGKCRHQHLKHDGSMVWVDIILSPLTDEKGDVTHMIQAVRDVRSDLIEAHEALRESEERYRNVVENIGIGVSVISPNMEILALNKQMKRWFPDVDLSKKPICYKAFNNPPRKTLCSYCPTCKTLKDGNVYEDITVTPAGDRIVNYRIISSPIKDKDGNIVAAIEMIEDVTERKRMEEELREFKTISDEANFGNAIADLKGNILYLNEAFAKMHGHKAEELITKNLSVFHTQEQMKNVHRLNKGLKKEGSFSAEEVWHVRNDGTVFPALMNATVIKDEKGKSLFLSASAIDISERKRAEEALQEREKELEIKTHNLEEMNTALRVLLKSREEDKKALEGKVVSNIKELCIPYIEELKRSESDLRRKAYIDILESNLNDIIAPFIHTLASKYGRLTPTEIKVAQLIKEGRSSKEIAELLHISPRTVGYYREQIREKLALKKTKANLRSHLLTIH